MAKKTTEGNSIQDNIKKEFGDGILVSGDYLLGTKETVVPFSPALDIILGGGIPLGRFVIVTGQPKCGKTSSVLNFAANFQQPQYKSPLTDIHKVYYFSIEGRLKPRDLLGVKGLTLDNGRFNIIQSAPGKILTAENYIDIAEKLINQEPGCLFIIDSFSALCTSNNYTSAIGDRIRDDTSLLLSRFCKRIANVIPINHSVVVGITHQIANQGPGMSQWTEASGNKIQYQVDVKLKAEFTQKWVVNNTQVGLDINWLCVTNALNCPPMAKCISKFRYGYGIDKEAEVGILAADFGLIDKGGSWYTIKTENGEQKIQGEEGLRNYLVSNPAIYNYLYNAIKKSLGLVNE